MERTYKGVCHGAVSYQSVNLEVRTQSVKRQEAESEVKLVEIDQSITYSV